MTTNQETNKKEASDWTNPIGLLIRDLEQFRKLLNLTIHAISIMPARPNLIKVLAEIEDEDSDNKKLALTEAENEARLAQQEIDSGFPLLHGQGLVWLWTTLESTVRNMVALRFEKDPTCYQTDEIKRLKVKLGEYEGLTVGERAFYVIGLFEREVGVPLKSGVGRFESLLELIGLGGPVPEQIKRTMFELSQVRNLLVHQRGIVDRRFLEHCPWFNLSLGESIIIRHQQFAIYEQAVFAYTSELVQRLRIYRGQERDKSVEETIIAIEASLKRLAEKDLRGASDPA